MFKRKIYDDLLKWKKESNGSSALLIEGARRIGKTTVATELGKNEYPAYYVIDFSRVPQSFKTNFNNLLDVDAFFSKLFLDLGMSPLPNGSLLIFDEIQFCPKARQAIKTLVADGRYHYIETGSLVSIKENVADILIPSEEEAIQMHPMDYEEFLWAIGCKYQSDTLLEHFRSRKKFDDGFHREFMKNFRLYLALGGMPKVILKYLEKRDFYAAENEKVKILKLYEDDLHKIDNKYGTICYRIWKKMPVMLSNHTTRFLASSIGERADSILFQNSLDKLEESKMVIPVYKCDDPNGGFALTKDETRVKLYFSDVGLFTSLIYAKGQDDPRDVYQRLILDKLSLNFGMLFENNAAQTLNANGLNPYYYSWVESDKDGKSKNYEIDFLINAKGKTIPLEIKSKRVSSISSLNAFKNKFGKNIGEKYIVKPNVLSYGDNLTYLPPYMLFALK